MLGFKTLRTLTIRTTLHLSVSCLAWSFATADAAAQLAAPEKPSVEVNLGALRYLRDAKPQQTKPAVTPKPAPTPIAQAPVAPAPMATKPVAPQAPVALNQVSALPQPAAPVSVIAPLPAPPVAMEPPLPQAQMPVAQAPVQAVAPVKSLPSVALLEQQSQRPAPVAQPPVKPVATAVPPQVAQAPIEALKPLPLDAAVSAPPSPIATNDGIALGTAVPIPLVGKQKSPVVAPEVAALPQLPQADSSDIIPPQSKPISKSPMMVPVPASPPDLPLTVTDRMNKTFAAEPTKTGIVSDLKVVKNPVEEKKKSKKEAQAKKKAVPDTAPFARMPKPTKDVDGVHEEPSAPVTKVEQNTLPADVAPPTMPELPALPPIAAKNEPAIAKVEEPVNLPVPAAPRADTSGVLPTPMAPLSAGVAAPEKLPPSELPVAAMDPKPTAIPESKMAALPVATESKAPAAKPFPELPKPPVAAPSMPVANAKKEPEPAAPVLPALPSPAVATKPALPPLGPITGEQGAVAKLPLPTPEKPVVKPTAATVESKPVNPPKLPDLPPLNTPTQAEPKSVTPPPQAMPALPPLPAVKPSGQPSMPPLPAPSSPSVGSIPVLPLPSAPVVVESGKPSHSLRYSKGKTDLTAEEKGELASLAEKIKASQGSARIVAYASGSAEESSVARRTSNARALQIRAFLIEKGVNPEAINVQAFGNKVDEDRADVFVK